MGHEIRKYVGQVDGNENLSSHVEADETYVGSVCPGKHGRGTSGKSIVSGMVKCSGEVILALYRVYAVQRRNRLLHRRLARQHHKQR